MTASGLSGRRLRSRSRADRGLAAGIAHQVVAADALHGEHAARAQYGNGRGERARVVAGNRAAPSAATKLQVRPALRAGDGLRVKAPIERILVFAAAVGAQLEAAHRRVRPVVRQRLDQRVARAALRAVDERIAMAPVLRIREFGEAIGAAEEIRRDGDLRRERRRARARSGSRARRRRRTRRRPARRVARAVAPGRRRHARIDPARRRAAQHDFDVAAEVAHEAVELQFVREPVDERPKADALHASGQQHATRHDGRSRLLHRLASVRRRAVRLPRPTPCGPPRRFRGCRRPTRCGTRPRPRPCTARSDGAACRQHRRAGIRSGRCGRARLWRSRSPAAFHRPACATSPCTTAAARGNRALRTAASAGSPTRESSPMPRQLPATMSIVSSM